MAVERPSSMVFARQKEACLAGTDFSRKGSIDEAICDLVQHINLQENFVTTSSCSGRTAVFSYPSSGEIKKKGCKWLYITHDYCTAVKVIESIKHCQGDVFFKFEAFVLHVQCSALEHAQRMLAAAVASGFRNSGISVSNKGKIIVAIRSTHSLEVPLTHEGKLLVSEEYIEYLVELANRKMKENFERIERLFSSLKKMSGKSAVGMKTKLSGAAKRKKKLGKAFTEAEVMGNGSFITNRGKMAEVSSEGANTGNSAGDEKSVNHGPLPSGFVSFNKVSSLKFTPTDRTGKQDCNSNESVGVADENASCVEVSCANSVEHVAWPSLNESSETDIISSCSSLEDPSISTVKPEAALHPKNTSGACWKETGHNVQGTCHSENTTRSLANTTSSSGVNVVAGKQDALCAPGGIIEYTKCVKLPMLQESTGSCCIKFGNNCMVSGTCENNKGDRGKRETPPMAVKGITAVTVISSGCSETSGVVKKAVDLQTVRDRFHQSLCLDNN